MKKINLKSYDFVVKDKEGKDQTIPVKVKDNIMQILFHPELKLAGRDLIKQNKLADKIEAAGDEIILETDEYSKLTKAFDVTTGMGRGLVELCERVYDAPTVEVEEKKKK